MRDVAIINYNLLKRKVMIKNLLKSSIFLLLLISSAWADIKIVGAYNHTIALKSNGTLLGWGDNGYDQLGLGDSIDYVTVPTLIDGADDIVDITAGEYHTIALKSDGTLLVWGDNGEGQLGLGEDIGEDEFPTPLTGVTDIIAITAGDYHTLALKSDGTLLGWGNNSNGQLGVGDKEDRHTPTPVPIAENIRV